MEKVKQEERFIGELVKELCEGLKLQQLGDSSKFIQRFDLLHASEQVCVSEPRAIERKFVTSRLRL
jgi:hypothetical protein